MAQLALPNRPNKFCLRPNKRCKLVDFDACCTEKACFGRLFAACCASCWAHVAPNLTYSDVCCTKINLFPCLQKKPSRMKLDSVGQYLLPAHV